MSSIRAALFLAASLLPGVLAAQSPAPTPAPIVVQPIAFTQRTLANGLRVYAIRDAGTANVSVQVWYDVGSKDDPKGRSGFAHMFEHLMFKATRNLVSEQFDRLTEDVGGYNNASTNDDYTNYYEVVPANHLQRLLFAEADRMASLVVEPVSFASERDVVKEELRQRTLAQPYGRLFFYLPQITYERHPYARPGIGSLANLEAASIAEVRAFHEVYYRPDNAILVVSGNFDAGQLDRWIDQYFARIKRPDRPIPRVTVAEPPRTVATRQTVYEPNTPLPAVAITWKLPADRDGDTPALTVLDTILSQGQSSRLYEDLVYRDQLAQTVETSLDTKQGPGMFAAIAIMAGGKPAEAGEAALRREVARLRDTPVTAAELAQARTQVLTANLRARETADGKASTIARSVIIDDDPRAADRQLAAIQRVTAADVQRVARKYLTDAQSAALRYLPAESAPMGVKGDTVGIAATVQVADLAAPADIAIVTPAPQAQRLAPPPPAAPVVAALPTPVTTKLANGMTLVTVERHALPLVTAALVVDAGGARDPAERAGLADMTAGLVTKGTVTRSATQIARQIEQLGGALSSDASWDGAQMSFTVTAAQAAPALAIMADVAQHPVFAPEELERARAQAIDSATVELKNPARLAGLAAARAVFGAQPYGHALAGTPASLKAITRGEVEGSYRANWRPDSTTLVLVGDITPDRARSLADAQFGGWRAPAGIAPQPLVASTAPGPRVIVIDLPEAGQAGVVVARPGIARADPDYYAASVANATLGVGFSSRLNQEIRIKRGLSYGAGSSLQARRDIGPIAANTQTKNPSAAEVVALTIAEMRRLGSAPVPIGELDARKAVLIGGFGRATETTAGIAGTVGTYVLDHVPLDELKRYTPAIEGVDAATLQRAAAKLFDPAAASIIVVGDAKQFLPALRQAYPQVEVIPAATLNLDSPTLK